VSHINLQPVVVLGASSMVGAHLLQQLRVSGCEIHAFSRSYHGTSGTDGVTWHRCHDVPLSDITNLKLCVCATPIWVLPDYFSQLIAAGVRRVVALSSTSVFTKQNSLDTSERLLSNKIRDAENNFKQWAQFYGVEWVILRPTMIYGSGADKVITGITNFIKHFGFFPLYGQASGLRQPVHAVDVARACVSALHHKDVKGMDFNLSGVETMTYKELVSMVFLANGLKPRFVAFPAFIFCLGFCVLRFLPRYHDWTRGMALRMNQDQICDHSEASSVLGFRPQGFKLENIDLPAEAKR